MKTHHQSGIKQLLRSLLIFVLFASAYLIAAEAEFRGLMIRGSDWAYEKGTEAKKAAISRMIREAAEQGFNSIIFQISEAGEAFYPSPQETWSAMFGESDPGFDPLDHALKEAAALRLQLIARMDVLAAYNAVTKPRSPEHIFVKNPKWLLTDNSFNPLRGDYYYYLDPSNPEVISYLKMRVAHVRDRYKVDGFYFSELRYPDDSILKNAAFQKQYQYLHAFNGASIEACAQDILSSCLESMVAEIRLRKPYLQIFAESEALPFEIKGFRDMYPADRYYFQKGLSWLENGLIDVLVPRLLMRSKGFENLYDAYLEASVLHPYIIPLVQGDVEIYREADVRKSLAYIRKKGGSGLIAMPAPDILKGKSLYEDNAGLPYLARTHNRYLPVDIDLDILHIPYDIVKITQDGRFRFVDQYNRLTFMLDGLPRTLNIVSMDTQLRYSTREWAKPYRYRAVSERDLIRPDAFIELRREPSFITQDSAFQFLFRASSGETRINGETLNAYPYTGIFFKWVKMASYGKRTRVRGSLYTDGDSLYYEDVYFGNMPDTSTLHAVILNSVSPRGRVLLPPDDYLRISFASRLADVMDTILLYANGKPYPLWYNGSHYIGEIPTRPFSADDSVRIQVAARDRMGKEYSYDLPLSLRVRPAESFPLIEVKEDFTPVSYSLGQVRLGGPYIHEYPRGVRFVTNGKYGGDYRIRLNPTQYAYVSEQYVRSLATGMPRPKYNITSISIQKDSAFESVTIPRPEPVPYSLHPEPELKRIRVRLYGVHSNSTWITHREGLELVDYVTWQQVDAETYDILVYLQDTNIWGYDLKQNERYLSLQLRYPPLRKNMLIALEAGHGGEWNWGALGLSGMKEKDVNRDVTEKVRDMLISMGYRVLEIRPADSSPTLRERWLMTDSLKADLFVSIHANAAGGDYLRVSGTSTYYNNPFWRDFASLTYDAMRKLPLEEFGVVGSFNYMMCRMSQRPSILVELAFMSHAGDESKMANPDFRTQMAKQITESVNRYIEQKLNRR
ncbi:MAG: N-acetylmuramoyl-L-alanine amidase [Candidatus Marinimicrobia bacterium]|nr:N-acetylmuramoyl-L-alanine amidase [Candidatus Neomarinimicrobiota bacterium]